MLDPHLVAVHQFVDILFAAVRYMLQSKPKPKPKQK